MSESIEEFERKLKEKLKKETEQNSLAEFEKQMQGQNPQPPQASGDSVVVPKNILLSFVSDATGCGHIRNVFPLTYLNSIFGKDGRMLTMLSPIFIFQPEILARCKAILFQRQMTPGHLQVIKAYKQHQQQLQYKMIWDMDDFIWGANEEQGGHVEDGVPSYNFGAKHITPEIKACSVEIMNLMDEITVSTEPMKDYIVSVLKVKPKVTVLPNAVPMYFWGTKRKEPIKEDLIKPRVIYTGSPTHYLNPIPPRPASPQEPQGFPGDSTKKLGDFGNAWKDWVIKNVKEDKITFIVMGGLPWFFEEIRDKIVICDWIDSYRYHLLVKEQNADFGIMPLVPNNFNRCKSDIKYIEHCAEGIVAIGTTFKDSSVSPYDNCRLKVSNDCTVEDIDKIFWETCKKENFNKVREEQYNDFYNQGRYLESPQFVNLMTSIYFN